ncbi:ABC transporter permease [Roseomonas gilardii]|uniref:ABC transporter permease n=1 Tax=Roseomonas gilardii TaxID=257708 RepID=UPI0011A66BEC|nr:ABC transporter permease [Roseomonas gilardii]
MTAATSPTDWRGGWTGPALLLAPVCLLLLLVFLLPIGLLLSRSLFEPDFTLEHYARLLGNSIYPQIFWLSLRYALISTLLALLASYPVAYVLSRASESWRALLLLCVLLPFWTNVLVRCYAWMLLLQVKGAVNLALVDWLHLLPAPLPLMFNRIGAVIGMVHYLMPIAILILDTNMRATDGRLMRAASSLGASPARAFFFVFLPQTWPGLRAAGILTFIGAIGSFVIPALLGGPRDVTFAMLVNTEFSETMNWGFGTALATVLLLVTLLLLGLSYALQTRGSRA